MVFICGEIILSIDVIPWSCACNFGPKSLQDIGIYIYKFRSARSYILYTRKLNCLIFILERFWCRGIMALWSFSFHVTMCLYDLTYSIFKCCLMCNSGYYLQIGMSWKWPRSYIWQTLSGFIENTIKLYKKIWNAVYYKWQTSTINLVSSSFSFFFFEKNFVV